MPDEKIKSTSLFSDVLLILNNLIPLIGVIFFEWNIFTLLILYWAESGVIGIFNIIKMIKIAGKDSLKMCLIFCFHYGLFMLGHYFFLIIGGIFIGLVTASMIDDGFFAPLWEEKTTFLAIFAMFISHGFSFLRNFLGKKEYEKITLDSQMIKPYGRILVIQVVILGSAFIMVMIQSDLPLIAITVLIIIKTVIDFIAHKKGHKAYFAS